MKGILYCILNLISIYIIYLWSVIFINFKEFFLFVVKCFVGFLNF